MSQSTTKSDAHVVQDVLSGQREAFAVLVRRYMPAIHALAFAQTGNHADADDVVQETFVKAYASLDTLREASKFGPWVATISKNTARSASRKRNRRAEVAMGELGSEAAAMPDVEARELRELLKRQIGQLDEAHREVLLLHYFSGMSAREIGGILGISKHAVHKRLQRARSELSDKVIDLLGAETEAHRPTEKSVKTIMGLVIASPVAWESAATAHETITLGGHSVANKTLPSTLNGAVKLIGRLSPIKVAIVGMALVVLLGAGSWLVANRAPDEFVPARPVVQASQSSNADILLVPEPETPESTVQASPSEQDSSETASFLQPTAPAEINGIWAVRGEVLNEEGSLVAGARVELELVKWYEHRTGYNHERPLPDQGVRWTTVSDDLGAFAFEQLPMGNYLVTAYTNMELGMVEARVSTHRVKGLLVHLRSGGTIAGVVQMPSGDAVSGAQVSIFEHIPESGDSLRPARPPASLTARTGPSGAFLLDRLWPGMWRLRVQAAGYPEMVTAPIAVGTWDATLTILRGSGLRGDVVLAGTAEPVAKAVITLKPELGVLEYSAESDDSGAFRLEDLPAGSFSVEIVHSDFKRVEGPASITLSGGENVSDVGFVFTEGASILGRVIDEETEEGIAGLLVGAEIAKRGNWDFGKASAPTDESGHYRISGLDSGEYRVTTGEAPGYPHDRFERSFAHRVVSVGEAGRVEGIDFSLSKGVRVAGKVVDEAGRPVEGAIVEGVHWGGKRIDEYSVSDEDGSFELWGFPAASSQTREVRSILDGLHLRARVPGGEQISLTLGPIQLSAGGLDDIVLALEAAATVSGYLIDGSGHAMAGASVMTRPEFIYKFHLPATTTDAHGNFRLTKLIVGTYGIRVMPAGTRDMSPILEWVNVKSGERITNLKVTYDSGLSISGFVTDTVGTPIPRARVEARSRESMGSNEWGASDSDGAFKIVGLNPGSYHLVARHPDYVRTLLMHIPSGTDEHHIVLEEAAVLEGLITLGGSPLQGVRIEVRPINDERRVLGRTSSDEDGTFEVRSLPAGEAVVRAFVVTGPEGGVYIDEQRVPLEGGAVTEIHINI